MIEPNKLWQLDGGQRRRKLALTFGALERDIAGIAEKGHEYSFPSMKREEYTKKVVQVLLKDPALPEESKNQLEELLKQNPFDELVLVSPKPHLLTKKFYHPKAFFII